jgi:hypothetical protein
VGESRIQDDMTSEFKQAGVGVADTKKHQGQCPSVDKEAWNWFLRLGTAGTAFIALFSIPDGIPFVTRIIGNLLVVGALLFLIDVEAGPKFRRAYWTILVVWIIVLCHSVGGLIQKSNSATEAYQTISYTVYAAALFSIPLLCVAMQRLCATGSSPNLEGQWSHLTRQSFRYYALPIVFFLGTSIVRIAGAEIKIFYERTDTSLLSIGLVMCCVRALFFVPPVLIILKLWKTREIMIARAFTNEPA